MAAAAAARWRASGDASEREPAVRADANACAVCGMAPAEAVRRRRDAAGVRWGEEDDWIDDASVSSTDAMLETRCMSGGACAPQVARRERDESERERRAAAAARRGGVTMSQWCSDVDVRSACRAAAAAAAADGRAESGDDQAGTGGGAAAAAARMATCSSSTCIRSCDMAVLSRGRRWDDAVISGPVSEGAAGSGPAAAVAATLELRAEPPHVSGA